MPIIQHDDLPIHVVPRIKTRIIVEGSSGAASTSVWEQWIHSDGHIPLHYHDVEEVLVILAGEAVVTLGDETNVVNAPASILIPPFQMHSLRPHDSNEIHLLAFFPTTRPTIFAPDGSELPMPWEDRQQI